MTWTSMGRRARRRIRAGGPRATGRPAASLDDWATIKALVLARARWRCQACGLRRRLEVHHVVKRAQGGSDFDLDRLVALCQACHAQTDAPYAQGRLRIVALGAGQFHVERVVRASKWAVPDGRIGPGEQRALKATGPSPAPRDVTAGRGTGAFAHVGTFGHTAE